MRVQLICAAFPPFGKGGGPAASELIARALVAAGHEIEVLTVSEEPYEDNRGSYWVRSLGSPNIYANYWRPNPTWKKVIWHLLENFNPVAFWRVHRRIRKFKPDLVMTVSVENINVASWVAAKANRLPVVHVIHSSFVMCWRGTMYANGKNCVGHCTGCRISSVGKRLAAHCVDAIIGETVFINRNHTKYGVFANARQYVIPSPIDRAVATSADDIVLPRRQGCLTVGYIGAILHVKGILTLARAAQRLSQERGCNIRFRIAGSAQDERFLNEVKSQFPAELTEFVGWTVASEFYQSVDVIVVPSLHGEPFARVSVEPLAYGVPVVAARSGGLPENVDEGISGLLFPPDDDAELAALLLALALDKQRLQLLSKGALAKAARYDFSIFSKQLDRAIREMRMTADARRNEVSRPARSAL